MTKMKRTKIEKAMVKRGNKEITLNSGTILLKKDNILKLMDFFDNEFESRCLLMKIQKQFYWARFKKKKITIEFKKEKYELELELERGV